MRLERECALFSLNGVEVIKSENTFTIDGANSR